MRPMQLLTACFAALMIPFRSNCSPVRSAHKTIQYKTVLITVKAAVVIAFLTLFPFNYVFAQVAEASLDAAATRGDRSAVQCEQCAAAPDYLAKKNPDPIMGFEYTNAWAVKVEKGQPYLNVQSTSSRTQGTAAYAVINPASEITLTSLPIVSTTNALEGIGKRGAMLQLDVRVQAAADPLFPEPSKQNATAIEGFLTVRSRGLNKVPLGRVLFQKYRTGIYNTISFSIPEAVSSALDGASYSDLIFEFEISSSKTLEGAYLFDNLRVHAVDLIQSPKGSAPPAGYGGSLNLVVTGNKPVVRNIALSPVQIPSGFHLKEGVVGTTTVQLSIGLESSPELSCMYKADGDDKLNKSYVMESCTNGYREGDLVNGSSVTLGITRGKNSQQLHAQLAVSPLGDLAGSGLIPPMPTYWGGADGCTPTPVHGKVVTTSSSCKSQLEQSNQIVRDYFKAVQTTHPTGEWIVAPVPESALRSGNGAPVKLLADAVVRDADASNNLPFDTGGDLNPGGSFDAYWRLSGNLAPTAVSGTDENLTHFDAAFTTHGVLFGDDIDVVDAKVTADTDSGETTPTYKPAKSSGSLGFYVFGEEIPSGGLSFNPSTGFSVDPSWNQEYDLPPVQVWIFDITAGAIVDADLKASGSAALSGADLSVVPTASLGGHVRGGINLGIAEGSVDAKINLITLSAPVTAQAKWDLNTTPELCAAELAGSLKGDVNIGSGGGEMNLDASFGICPFCATDSWTLIKWNPLVSKSWNLFNEKFNTPLFGLPDSMCGYPITVSIASPTSEAKLTSGLPIVLTGIAKPKDPKVAYTSTYNWTYTPGANASTITVNPVGAHSANPTVTFGPAPAGKTATWTIGLTATTTDTSASTPIKETATATPITVKVSKLRPGAHISEVVTHYNGVAVPDPVTGVLNVGNFPGSMTVYGIVSGGTGTLNTIFTVVQCNDETPACSSPGAPATLVTSGAATKTPSAFWTDAFSGGFWKFTMSTSAGDKVIGTASAVIYGDVLQ